MCLVLALPKQQNMSYASSCQWLKQGRVCVFFPGLFFSRAVKEESYYVFLDWKYLVPFSLIFFEPPQLQHIQIGRKGEQFLRGHTIKLKLELCLLHLSCDCFDLKITINFLASSFSSFSSTALSVIQLVNAAWFASRSRLGSLAFSLQFFGCCIHILMSTCMGLGHNDTWLESHL